VFPGAGVRIPGGPEAVCDPTAGRASPAHPLSPVPGRHQVGIGTGRRRCGLNPPPASPVKGRGVRGCGEGYQNHGDASPLHQCVIFKG